MIVETELPASSAPDDAPTRRLTVDAIVWILIAAAVGLFWLVSTSWRPWDLFDRAGFSADFYDEQARSFIRGRLAVRPEVAGPEGFVVDGRTYLYYGPFLAVVRIPFALFGDLFAARLVRLSMLIALVVLGRWSARLARAGRSVVTGRSADDDRDRWPIGLFVAAVLFSPALFAAGWVSVYHETELWALTLAVVSYTLLAEWAASRFSDRRRFLWAAAAALAATMTRAPIGLGVAVSIGLIGLWLVWRSRDERGRDGWVAVVAGLVPLVGYAIVNRAKFGTWLSVPGDRQVLTLQSPERAAFFESTGGSFFSVQFLPTTLVQYLRPDTIRFERLVPGIRFGPLAENYGSLDVETVTPASSLIVSATLLVVVGVVGLWWMVRDRARAWLVLVVGGVLGAIPSFLIGFVANRYLIDMLPPLIVAGAIGVWWFAGRERQRVVRVIGVGLVVWGAWVNAALATWTAALKSPGFTELRSDVDAFVFGGGDVGIVDLDPSAVPRDGIVGLTAGCNAVYIAEQGRWVALERADGVAVVRGRVESSRAGDPEPVTLAGTTEWTVEVVVGADESELRFVDLVGAEGFVAVAPAVPFDYEVVVDPLTTEARVTLAGETDELPFSTYSSAARTGIGGEPEASDLCRTLAGRR